MTTIKLATASAAAISLLLVAVSQRGPAVDSLRQSDSAARAATDPVQQSIVVKDIETFDDRWLAAVKLVMFLATMAAPQHDPVLEQSELSGISNDGTRAPPATFRTPNSGFDSRDGSQAIKKPPDVCRRHGMHKVSTRGGRSWRCR